MSNSRKEEVACKLVQEIAKKGEEIPEKYILKNEIIAPAIDASSTLWNDTLLIDFSLLSSNPSSSSLARNELSKLHYALKDWGCFQVVNHGMTSLFLDELLEISRQFFEQPLEEKLKCTSTDDYIDGYKNAAPFARNKALNWYDRLYLTVYPEDQRKLQVWPKSPQNFRTILHEFSLNARVMLEVVFKAMARSLGLEEDSFIKEHGKRGLIDARFGFYPRCSRPDQVYGVHPHSDKSSVTILLQNKNVPDGLHIENDGQWYKVPIIPGAVLVNLGDFAEVMSNGIFKSVVHRVVTNPERQRFSVAAFCSTDADNELGPISKLINANQTQVYRKVNTKTYDQLFLETYPYGKRVLDALRI